MFEEQKKLLADLKAAERAALKLWVAGVKLSGVVQKVRAAASELETRVRYLEKNAPPKPKPKPTPNRPAPAAAA